MAKANKIKIGKVRIDSPTALAPMAGINNATFRYFCKKYGCGLIYSPMIHCEALIHNKDHVLEKLAFSKDERPLVIQLIGHKAESFPKAAKIIEKYADIIDINFGCPDDKIIESKAGSWYLDHLDKMKKVVNALTSATKLPVTVKIRTGFSRNKTEEIIKVLNECNIAAITIHARTAKQKYSGKPCYDEIKKAKEISIVPIIANGDIDDNNMQEVLEYTKADMVMIGRKAIGNPFIFGNQKVNPKKFIKEFFEEYLRREKVYKVDELRQHLCWISCNFEGAAKLRSEIMNCKTIDEIAICIKNNT